MKKSHSPLVRTVIIIVMSALLVLGGCSHTSSPSNPAANTQPAGNSQGGNSQGGSQGGGTQPAQGGSTQPAPGQQSDPAQQTDPAQTQDPATPSQPAIPTLPEDPSEPVSVPTSVLGDFLGTLEANNTNNPVIIELTFPEDEEEFSLECLSALQDSDVYFELVLPEGVTDIGTALQGLDNLTSVTIPETVTSIEYAAFLGCLSLVSVSIPNSVTSIGESAFYGCSSLASVSIPGSVTEIDSKAFQNCTGLTSVTFSDPTGWQYAGNINAADPAWTDIDFSNAEEAATWLTEDGVNKYLRKVTTAN